MSAAELAAFETYLEPVSFDDGVIIIREGEQSRAMYFVVRGKVGIYKGTEGGGRIFPADDSSRETISGKWGCFAPDVAAPRFMPTAHASC